MGRNPEKLATETITTHLLIREKQFIQKEQFCGKEKVKPKASKARLAMTNKRVGILVELFTIVIVYLRPLNNSVIRKTIEYYSAVKHDFLQSGVVIQTSHLQNFEENCAWNEFFLTLRK